MPAATPLRKRFPQQTKLLSRGSALGSTKGHHSAPTFHITFNTSFHVHSTISPIPTTAPLTAQSFTNVAPFLGLFSTVFSCKQNKRQQ